MASEEAIRSTLVKTPKDGNRQAHAAAPDPQVQGRSGPGDRARAGGEVEPWRGEKSRGGSGGSRLAGGSNGLPRRRKPGRRAR